MPCDREPGRAERDTRPHLDGGAVGRGDLDLGLDLLVVVLVILIVAVLLTTEFDELVRGLLLASNDAGALVVERGVAGGESLLEGKDLVLEFGLDLGLLGLDALEAINALADGGREGLEVAAGPADERGELVLDEAREPRVLLSVSRPSLRQ
jgi:hypothetical protein